MVRCSNNLVGFLNFLTFILSIPILGGGIWLQRNAGTECQKFLDTPIIALGVFLLIVSIAGLIGGCCRVTWLLWVYLFVMFFLIVLLFCFTVFAFVVTNEGAGKVLSDRGYQEYRLGDYSNWLQRRVESDENWNRIKSCIMQTGVCDRYRAHYMKDTPAKFYTAPLNSLESGCCKPPHDCGFTYHGPTNWTKPAVVPSNNKDCKAWDNRTNVLCFNCESCKAGLLDNIKRSWKRIAILNIIVLIFLIIVYSVGCCAFRNSRMENYYRPAWRNYRS